MLNLFIVVSILIIQLLIIGMLYKYHKTLAHPTIFFQTYFTIHIILALVAFGEYDFNFYGVLWILLAMFLFSLGGLLAEGMVKSKSAKLNSKINRDSFYNINARLAKIILIISIIIGCLYTVEFFIRSGLTARILFNLQALLELNNEVAVQRYTGSGIDVSKISRIFLTFIYFSPLIAGFNFNYFQGRKLKCICIMSMIPSLLVVLTQNTKATLIAAVFLFVSGYIASSVILNKGLPRISFKRSIVILSGALSFYLCCICQ